MYDTQKGSFYVNCAFYKVLYLSRRALSVLLLTRVSLRHHVEDPTLTGASGNYPDFPEYTAPNIWPDESILPGFRSTFEELCRLIIDTAVLVARACDRYAEHAIHGYRRGCLERIVRESTTTKARLLHYFPSERSYASASGELADDRDRKSSGHDLGDVDDDDDDDDGVDDGGDTSDWCAPHLDHGCLTGLTSAMYVDELAQSACIRATAADQAPPPLKELDPSTLPRSAGYSKAGLYILSRTNSPVKVSIPPDHLAFQTGEALQVITRGRFKAVPHFVRGPRSGRRGSRKERDLGKERERGVDREMMGVARNTLAVFTREFYRFLFFSSPLFRFVSFRFSLARFALLKHVRTYQTVIYRHTLRTLCRSLFPIGCFSIVFPLFWPTAPPPLLSLSLGFFLCFFLSIHIHDADLIPNPPPTKTNKKPIG